MANGAFGWSEGIALASFAVSLFALGWAKASASAAERANDFQLHTYQKQTYLEFFKLWIEFQQAYLLLKPDPVFAFNDYARTAPLYFDDHLAKKIDTFHTLCWRIANKAEYRHRVMQDMTRYEDDLFEGPFLQQQKKVAQELWDELFAMCEHANELGREIDAQMKTTINILRRKPNVFRRLAKMYSNGFDWENEGHPPKDQHGREH